MSTTVRIKAADGEFFVSATTPGRQSMKPDSVWYCKDKALYRAGKLLEGAHIGDDVGDRLTERLSELERINELLMNAVKLARDKFGSDSPSKNRVLTYVHLNDVIANVEGGYYEHE